jgi:hypothetical protein
VPPCKELFPVGTRVRVAPDRQLEEFRETWQFHHPLTAEQVAFAGRETTVRDVAFYHGGDVLYTLDGFPGIWHEQCLAATE